MNIISRSKLTFPTSHRLSSAVDSFSSISPTSCYIFSVAKRFNITGTTTLNISQFSNNQSDQHRRPLTAPPSAVSLTTRTIRVQQFKLTMRRPMRARTREFATQIIRSLVDRHLPESLECCSRCQFTHFWRVWQLAFRTRPVA